MYTWRDHYFIVIALGPMHFCYRLHYFRVFFHVCCSSTLILYILYHNGTCCILHILPTKLLNLVLIVLNVLFESSRYFAGKVKYINNDKKIIICLFIK